MDISSMKLNGYTLIAIPNGFTNESSGSTMCDINSVYISDSTLSILIRNYSTTVDAKLSPIVQILRVKAI